MAHITVQVGEKVVESMISRKSAEELHLKKGDKVVVIIKSTEVMIQKDGTMPQRSLAHTHD